MEKDSLFTKIKIHIRTYITQADWFLISICLLCSLYGLLLIASATLTFSSRRLVMVQGVAIVLGFFVMIIVSKFDYTTICELSKFLFVLCVLAMGVTLVIGTGPTGTTNKSWIDLKFFNLQPAEFVKIGFILTFSYHLTLVKEHINQIKHIVLLLLHAGIIIGLVLLTGDLGVAGVFMFITLIMLFCAGLKIWYFLGGAAVCVAAAPFLWEQLNEFHRKRILYTFYPELDPMDIGYQVVQSKIAIGSGQLTGKGIFSGPIIQSKLLPAKQTDFIFATAGEELGFLGAIAVIALLTLLIIRIIIIAKQSRSDLGTMVCTGIFAMFLIQFVGNIGMCIGLFPVIGITLPFFSYGGSSMLSNYIAIGVLLSVYMRRRQQS